MLRHGPVLHHPSTLALPQDAAATHPPSDAGSPCVSPMEEPHGLLGPPPAAPQPEGEPGAAEDVEDADDTEEEEELLAQPQEGAREEKGPGALPQGVAEEGEESRGRKKITLTPLEKIKLSTLNLTGEAEPEPPPKPARLRLQAAPEALPALWKRQDAWEEDEDVAMEEGTWLQSLSPRRALGPSSTLLSPTFC